MKRWPPARIASGGGSTLARLRRARGQTEAGAEPRRAPGLVLWARWAAGLGLAASSGAALSLSMAPAYAPLAAGAWIPLLLAIHLVAPPAPASLSALLPAAAWTVYLARDPGCLPPAGVLMAVGVWALARGEREYHHRRAYRLLAGLTSLQVVGMEKLRSVVLGEPWGHHTWASALHAHPLCYPLAQWLGPSAATLAIAVPQCMLVQALLRWRGSGTGRPSGGQRLHTWVRLAAAVTPVAALLIPWGMPGILVRPQPAGLTVVTVQPGWTTRTHPGIWRALRAGDSGQVRRILLDEAEGALHLAAGRGASLVTWPLDYLNFDPADDRAGAEHLRRLARASRAVLVFPYAFWTPQGPTRGVAVAYPTALSPAEGDLLGSRLVPGQTFTFPLAGRRVMFVPVPTSPVLAGPGPPPRNAGGTAGLLACLLRRAGGPLPDPKGAAILITAAREGFFPLDLVPHAAAAGVTLVHAGWGGSQPPPGRAKGETTLASGRRSTAQGVSLIADPLRWRTAVAPPGPALLAATVPTGPDRPAPAPGWVRTDPLGWLGLGSLLASAGLYRRPPRRAQSHPAVK